MFASRRLFSDCIRATHVHRHPIKRQLLREPGLSNLPPAMVDVSSVIENIEYHKQNVMERRVRRPAMPNLDQLAERHEQWKSLKTTLARTRHEQKMAGLEIQAATTKDAKNAALKRASEFKQFILSQEQHLNGLHKFVQGVVLSLPNTTHQDAPIGPEPCAVIKSEHGPEPVPLSGLRDHASIMESLGMVDFKAASLVAGGSWYYLRGAGALLEMALTNYALSVAIKHGWEPFTTPDAIRTEVALRCGFQPRDVNTAGSAEVDHFYHLEHTSGDLVLAGTAEIPLAGLYANQTFTEQDMAKRFPIKMVGVGHAFRSEAGSRGKDTRGLYRVHQFTKVELFAMTGEEASEEFMEEMLSLQREIFSGLGFPYRVLDMPTEELGAAAHRKYDIEAWMPGRGWGEISSTSNCTDYQSRRLLIRYRPLPTSEDPNPGLRFVHTLNGTAAAIPRLLIALIENGVEVDSEGAIGSLNLPVALRRFWLGGDNVAGVPIHWFEPAVDTDVPAPIDLVLDVLKVAAP